MISSGLPPLRWLLAGALAAGLWATHAERAGPRPPRPVEPVAVHRPSAPAARPVRRPPARVEAQGPVLPPQVARPATRPDIVVTGAIPKPSTGRLATRAVARLRATAAADAKVLATLPAGTAVERLAEQGAWRLVAVAGRKGWVHASLLGPPPPRPPLPIARAGAAKPKG